MIKTEIIKDDELPYRIEIDNLRGAAKSPAKATLAALSVGKIISSEMRNNPKLAASHIFWYYEANPDWVKLISILEQNSFDV